MAPRDSQFSSAPYGGSYGSARSGQYGLAVPGSYYGPVAVPARDDAAREYAARAGISRDGTAQEDTAREDTAREDTAQDDPDRSPQWPLQTRLDLGALPGAVPCARLHARLVLTEWGQAQAGDSVELIVSELMTNALRACTDPVAGRPGYDAEGRQLPLGLRLASDRRQVLVEIWDGSMAPPMPGQTGLDGETGRGLLMVEAVSSRWGYYFPARQPSGTAPEARAAKVVWALIVPGA
ncbi:MAG: ATP-binding protein [Streptosporangiaceae bacterium]